MLEPTTPPFLSTDDSVAGRVLVLAPSEVDSAAIVHVLENGGFRAHQCSGVAHLTSEASRNDFRGASAFVIIQEALFPLDSGEHQRLALALAQQPGWSDVPVILLASGSEGEGLAWNIARRLDPVGNITILERPLRTTTLVNAVAVALRARKRQHELRETLVELETHRLRLQELVEKKTAELAESISSLHAAERLASLGTLAAGLGHDIANLALPIRARLEILRESCANSEAQVDLDAIQQALTHLSHLSAGMRLMALDPTREGSSDPAIDLEEWAAETIPMLRASLPRTVRLEYHIRPGLGVRLARHRLVQAVFNLVQNAGEAMAAQASGLVRLTVEPIAGDKHKDWVCVRISDNGPGMTPAVRARCFEPYFSTKGRAISTGMGLGLVKGIVDSAGGSVSVESEPDKGTTFTLLLPQIAIEPDAANSQRRRTGAVSVSNARMASLVRMFLEQLDTRCIQPDVGSVPLTDMWVMDEFAPQLLVQYLTADPLRRVVVLHKSGAHTGPPASGACAAFAARIIALPECPSPGELRDALVLSDSQISAKRKEA